MMTRLSRYFAWIAFLFHGSIVFLILSVPTPKTPAFPPVIWDQLLDGKAPFIQPGSEFEAYKPFLPRGEKISFIMDYPFSPYVKDIANFYTAQSYLVPVILSHEPDQKTAIIYCSNKAVAERRMSETGYRPLTALGDGKGIAEKIT